MTKSKIKVDKKNIRSLVAIIVLVAIVLFASYSYYSGVKPVKNVNVTIDSDDTYLLMYYQYSDLASDFSATDLVKADRVINDNYYGYIDGEYSESILSGSSSLDNKLTCNYEIWYNPVDVFTSTYEENIKKLTLIGNIFLYDAAGGNSFEFDITNVSERTKIMDTFFNFSDYADVVWQFNYRLYDLVNEETSFDTSASGQIEFVSNGCKPSNLYFKRGYTDGYYSGLTNGHVAFVNLSPEDDITVQTTGPVEAYIADNELYYNKTGVGDASIVISNEHGGIDSLNFKSDVNINFNNIMSTNANTNADMEYECNGISVSKNRNGEYLVDFADNDQHECIVSYSNRSVEMNDYFNTYIESLVDSTSSQTDWKVKKLHYEESGLPYTAFDSIKYVGNDPDNYVWFNNEYWRILGVSGFSDHGISDNLVKIIRDVPIGEFDVGSSVPGYEAVFPNSLYESKIMDLLNNYYYYHDSVSNTYTRTPEYSFDGSGRKFRNGIKNPTSFRMIETVRHRSFGDELYLQQADGELNVDLFRTFDTYENYDGFNYTGEIHWASKWMGALTSNTKTKAGGGFEPCFYPSRCAYYDSLNRSNPILPVVYLKSDVYLLDGDGSMANPFILGIDWEE